MLVQHVGVTGLEALESTDWVVHAVVHYDVHPDACSTHCVCIHMSVSPAQLHGLHAPTESHACMYICGHHAICKCAVKGGLQKGSITEVLHE